MITYLQNIQDKDGSAAGKPKVAVTAPRGVGKTKVASDVPTTVGVVAAAKGKHTVFKSSSSSSSSDDERVGSVAEVVVGLGDGAGDGGMVARDVDDEELEGDEEDEEGDEEDVEGLDEDLEPSSGEESGLPKKSKEAQAAESMGRGNVKQVREARKKAGLSEKFPASDPLLKAFKEHQKSAGKAEKDITNKVSKNT